MALNAGFTEEIVMDLGGCESREDDAPLRCGHRSDQSCGPD
jgi:hypothetical protein